MGAGVSTEGAPLTKVKCKNNLGVLFDREAEEAFHAAATGPEGEETVPWPVADAYVKTRDERWRDPKHVLFQNLKQFRVARVEIEKIADDLIKGSIREIPQRGQHVGDECQQRGLDGTPTTSLDPLYEIAAMTREVYANVMNDVCEGGPPLNLAPLKGRARAEVKAQNEYADKTAPCYSWLFDIVRGSVYCDHEDELVALWKKIEADPRVEIVRTKNRFNPPLFNGYRDIMMNVAVNVEMGTKRGFMARMCGGRQSVTHLCELQIHLTAIKKSEPMHMSHAVYEFFRDFFKGNAEAVEQRLNMFCALPVDDVKDADELVEVVLGSGADAKLLDGLCDLLKSIQESAGVVKVREVILAKQERAFGAESKEVGAALRYLGGAYGDLGYIPKKIKVLERVLPIYEREYGSNGAEVASVLNDLGTAYGKLGDPEKKRNLLERALAINERVYGSDHVEVAITLGNLGNAYSFLGNQAKKRDMLGRALTIFERECGKDSTEVAQVLMNLGNAYGSSGDHAKKRDMLERALAIGERAYGRDHVQVAITLVHLGAAYGAVGDHVKRRDMLERALAMFEQAYSRNHTELANTLYNLGNTCGAFGSNRKGQELLERALAIKERTYGRDHLKVAKTLYNLGSAYGQFGDHVGERDMLERALAIFERANGGADSAEMARTLTNLGTVYSRLGYPSKKRDVLERALAIQERAYGRDHAQVAITLTSLSNAVRALGDPSKAVELLERALAINESAHGKDHVNTAYTLMELGEACCDLGDTAKKREYFTRTVKIFEDACGPNHPHVKWYRAKLEAM